MKHVIRVVFDAVLLVTLLAGSGAAIGSKTGKIDELLNLHDLKTTVAIGNYYLKQEALINVRAYLAQAGREQNLGPQWNAGNTYWKQAEQALMAPLLKGMNSQFANLEWLSEEWASLNEREFSESDLDKLLLHLRSDSGRKQVMIMDHGIAFHVLATLGLSDKLRYNYPGAEQDMKAMQDLFNDEEERMRFNHNDNPEATAFAFSPVGKKYYVNAVLKVTGMVSQQLNQTAAALPERIQGLAGAAQPAIEAFKSHRDTDA